MILETAWMRADSGTAVPDRVMERLLRKRSCYGLQNSFKESFSAFTLANPRLEAPA